MEYLLLKWVHIVSSTILFGTGLGSAFFMLMANLRGDLPSIRFTTRYVVMADWIFTTPAVIIQLITGLALIHLGGFNINEPWITWALILYLLVGICWLPVVYIQIKMRNLAHTAYHSKKPLPQNYWKLHRQWVLLGSLAFPMVLIIFYLMVTKP